MALQAEALARRGHHVALVSPAPLSDWLNLSQARFECTSFRDSEELARAQVRVATFWTTVAPALSLARGPVFHLCQGYEGSFGFYAGQRGAIEKVYRAPTRKLTISDTLRRRLDELGFGPSRDVGQAFDSRAYFPGSPRNPAFAVILLVGPSQADVKGIDVALEGLRIWRQKGGQFRLCRVSPLPPSGQERASDLIDAYHHALDPSRMPFAYRAADLFIGPSREEEGFGLPVVEALATGLPTLLSDTPTHREIAGDAAWYFPEGSPEGLAAALPPLSGSEARRRARARGPAVARRFDPAAVAERLELAFLQALAEETAKPVSTAPGSQLPSADAPSRNEGP